MHIFFNKIVNTSRPRSKTLVSAFHAPISNMYTFFSRSCPHLCTHNYFWISFADL